ncbi:MAG: hypothetical protein MI824_11760 [Hyphomicrobiales bacterium]|nr:hypothetical protein [Hyphomicrobiales bacterium]
MARIRLPNDWQPRDYQLPAWQALEAGCKRGLLIWHRRSGKDDVGLHWTACAAQERVGTYWHMLPQYGQARKAIWDAVDPHKGRRRIDLAFPKALREGAREDMMTIRFKSGSMWHLVGSDNYDTLVGTPPVGVVFSEWALADPKAWAFLRPILAENGGWALFVTTSRGRNHAARMFETYKQDPGWFVQRLKATETDVFSALQLEQERREYIADYGEEEGSALYEQEYLCSFDGPVFGAFYARELRRAQEEGRIGRVPYDRAHPVHTAWDLGYTDSTAIWFIQAVGKERRLIDFHEGSGVGLDVYARVLRSKPYLYGHHYFPHDAEHHELTTGESRVDTLRGLGIEPTVVPQHNVLDGINATRHMLDRTWIDEETCGERGLEALRQYRREWDDRLKDWKRKPLHDWTSHAADALRTFAAGFDEPELVRKPGRHRRWPDPQGSAWTA